jgi:hypothetical protein
MPGYAFYEMLTLLSRLKAVLAEPLVWLSLRYGLEFAPVNLIIVKRPRSGRC